MDEQAIVDHLKEKYPGAFEGWDEFELALKARQRKDEEPLMLVVLYNKGTEGPVVELHAAFLLTSDKDGQDVIRLGNVELVAEYDDAYIPKKYRNKRR